LIFHNNLFNNLVLILAKKGYFNQPLPRKAGLEQA